MVTPGAFHAASRSSANPAKSGDAAAGSGVCTSSDRAWHTSTRRSAASQLFLELRRNQAIVRIAGGVAPFRERGFVLGLLQFQFNDALLFTPTFHVPPFSFPCRLDGHRI